MRRVLLVAGLVALLAGCGPSTLEQRICDVFKEQLDLSIAAYIRDPETAPAFTAEGLKDRVAARLGRSIREVDAALKKCGPQTHH